MPLGINGDVRPAPGRRGYSDGTLNYLGYFGFNWSCTSGTSDITVRCLVFSTQGTDPNNVTHHAHGFQLRCLSE
ncbi:hypothetical protein [uncultured Rikenella sp.]|uniref:hypothetical protein n=1 Tax=uncultured Rikenella sp. TaxID=368003 RepID=UPI00260C7750|nr:hypothetical protein [uncultured Rikenella sp.]